MNAERLLSVLNAIRVDFGRADLAALVDSVAAGYSQSLSQPSESAISNLDAQIAALRKETDSSATVSLPPSMERILGQIGGLQYVGKGLASRVSDLIAENNGTPARAVVALQELARSVTGFQQSASQAHASLQALGVTSYVLPLDSCEVGVSIPEALVGESLGGFQQKLSEFDRTIRTFAEVAGEEMASPPLRDLARGSFEFFVLVHPLTAAALVTAVERSVALYKGILEIRKLRTDLELKNVPTAALAGVKDYEASVIDTEVAGVRERIIAGYTGDQGRKNELNTALGIAIKFLAGQIDKGVDVEVTCNESNATLSGDATQPMDGPKSLLQAYEKVRTHGGAVRSLPANRAPVLFLPPLPAEPPPPDDPTQPAKTKSPKTSK